MDFTHFDENGNAIMIDVSSKDTTQRTAIAYGEICVGQEILEKIENHQMKKGDDMTQSTRKLTMGSLFDGISGFPLASVRCGIEPIWASEIEPFPILVSKIRFPRMEQMGDITKLNGAYLPPVDIICGGSPCQDSAWPECAPD